MKKHIKKLKKVRRLEMIEHDVKEEVRPEVVQEEDDRTTLDMTGWEEDFDFSDMRGLFFIQKGQYSKSGTCVTVKDGGEYEERYVGGYDPNAEGTVSHYCVMDKITFHTVYGGSSLEKALECLEKVIINYGNNPERYFEAVSESTNEDFYYRHFQGLPGFSDATAKKRVEDGRSWKSSIHTKRTGYAVYKLYGRFFEDVVYDTEERAVQKIEENLHKKRNKMRKLRKRVRKLNSAAV